MKVLKTMTHFDYFYFCRIYLCKQWHLLKAFTGMLVTHLYYCAWFMSNDILLSSEHTGLVTGVRFGRNASFVASVAMDRNLKYFGLQQ